MSAITQQMCWSKDPQTFIIQMQELTVHLILDWLQKAQTMLQRVRLTFTLQQQELSPQ